MIKTAKQKIRSLQNHQGFMRYFANTSWLFGEKILRIIVGLFVGIWVARYLGPERFGLFSYAQSFVGLFSAIATLGLDGIVVRELVKDIIGFKCELAFNTDKPDGTMVELRDHFKIHSLGWKHKVELEDGIKTIYEW